MNNENVRELGGWGSRLWYPLKFACKERISTWLPLIICIGIYLVLFWTMTPGETDQKLFTWMLSSLEANWNVKSDHINLVIQFSALFVIVAVWFVQLRNDWKGSLDEFIIVQFTYNGKRVDYLCSEAYAPLLSGGDIRTMAQSIGQIRNNGKRLELNIEKNKIKKKICIDSTGEVCCSPFHLYELEMPLLKAPTTKDPTTKTVKFTDLLKTVANDFDRLDQEFGDDEIKKYREILRLLVESENKKNSTGKETGINDSN